MPQSNQEQLSTPTHVLLSLSSLDISPKVGDNINNLRGTNKDDSHASFSKSSVLITSPIETQILRLKSFPTIKIKKA